MILMEKSMLRDLAHSGNAAVLNAAAVALKALRRGAVRARAESGDSVKAGACRYGKEDCEDARTRRHPNRKEIDIDGLKVSYLEAGSGDSCLLLVHGGVNNDAYSTWVKWNGSIEALSEGRRVVAVDLPGYGLSERPEGKCSQGYYIDFVGKLMGRLGIRKADMVGTSMGGGIALGYALENSGSVGSLVLISPYGLGFGLPRTARIALRAIPHGLINKCVGFLDDHKGFTRRITNLLFGSGAASIRKAIVMMNRDRISESFLEFISRETFTLKGMLLGRRAGMRTDYTKAIYGLNNTGIRTLFIQGENDTIVRLEDVRRITSGLKSASLDVVEGCKHSPHFQKPDRVNGDIKAFLSENQAV